MKGDKVKLQQILSCLMELALQMTDVGEISLKSTLDKLDRKEKQYLIAFSINFTPTSPHSKEIISHLLSTNSNFEKSQLKADLKKKENLGIMNKFTGIPHLQIGLVRDVIYKIISFMKGTYKVYTKGETVMFQIKLPVNLGRNANDSKYDQNELSISPFRSVENGEFFIGDFLLG